ncbi:HPr-rel-A system PqqD family peptide chaperone [Roseateles sp. BYS87W]|uniref:HPr-rel-A system PqqD family peptide chaperone n=2 Tax=Pelomonas baiyunensis TaxID=3299026 RepID=A0ABW7GZF9_9BURK
MATRWQLNRPHDMHVREWEDGGVIYDAISGNTHLLDPLALELLDLLRQRPWSVPELVTDLQHSLPDDVAVGEMPSLLTAKLEQLTRLELVKPA